MSVFAKWKRINLKNSLTGLSEGVFGIKDETISVKNVLPDEGMVESRRTEYLLSLPSKALIYLGKAASLRQKEPH